MSITETLVIEGLLTPEGFHQTNGGSFAGWLAEHDAIVWDAGYSAAYKDTAYIDAALSMGTTPNPHRPA